MWPAMMLNSYYLIYRNGVDASLIGEVLDDHPGHIKIEQWYKEVRSPRKDVAHRLHYCESGNNGQNAEEL
ncbi:hypothetical protein MUB24_03905 [Lederbergia sp. NSJ-179]|uniref:hypothetical protein n=1 Tax=Lederbergia sp. NSJ-179 TaxID=2931402 RepID=UPI001FD0EAA2|nr:hypothetical protein [Lederbergia sp. NSJ-179]MCJ7840069.1 hypothetical protein [Lederbergia sp. NSJ-179]